MSAVDRLDRANDRLAHWSTPPAPAHTTYGGRYVRLEPLKPDEHADRLYAQHLSDADPASWRWLGYGPFDSLAAYRRWVSRMTSDPDLVLFAICDAVAESAPLGVGGYLRIDRDHGSLEIGHLHFSQRLRRTRMATEAIALWLGHAFNLGYRRIEWKCDAENAASHRAAMRFGFTFEGVFRQHRVVKGRNRDTAWFSLLDHEWPARRAAFESWLAQDNFAADGRQRMALSQLMEGSHEQ